MVPKRHYGSVSLAIAVGGFVAAEVARRAGWLAGDAAELVVTGFEAATVGGVADWFAVSALFRRVPIPVLGRHTDIIVRNRARITDNIVDIVEREWLAPEVVGRKLGELLHSGTLLAWLDQPRRRAQAESLTRHVLDLCSRQLGSAEAAGAIARLLTDQLAGLDLARPLGAWLEQALARGEHASAWAGALRALGEQAEAPTTRALLERASRDALAAVLPGLLKRATEGETAVALEAGLKRMLLSLDLARPVGQWLGQAIANGAHAPIGAALIDGLRGELRGSPSFRRLLDDLVADAIDRWKGRGWKQRLLGGGAEAFGALKREAIATDVAAAIDDALADAARDPAHALRKQLDRSLASFAERLAEGDRTLAEPLSRLARELIERADLRALIGRLSGWLQEELLRPDGFVDWSALAAAAAKAVRSLADDAAARPDHPLRAWADAELLSFAKRLACGEAGATALAAEAQRRFLAHLDLDQALRGSLARLQGGISAQLADPESPLMRLARRLIDGALTTLREDSARRERLDHWLRSAIEELVREHHDLIGDMVRASLDPRALSDRALVDQIEAKVGDDLQYIRLNGAIVGGMVGVALAAFRLYVV